jgi:hypothetical protein
MPDVLRLGVALLHVFKGAARTGFGTRNRCDDHEYKGAQGHETEYGANGAGGCKNMSRHER